MKHRRLVFGLLGFTVLSGTLLGGVKLIILWQKDAASAVVGLAISAAIIVVLVATPLLRYPPSARARFLSDLTAGSGGRVVLTGYVDSSVLRALEIEFRHDLSEGRVTSMTAAALRRSRLATTLPVVVASGDAGMEIWRMPGLTGRAPTLLIKLPWDRIDAVEVGPILGWSLAGDALLVRRHEAPEIGIAGVRLAGSKSTRRDLEAIAVSLDSIRRRSLS